MLEEKGSINNKCATNESCTNEYRNNYNLKDLILFGKEEKLIEYVNNELLIPYQEESTCRNKITNFIKFKLLKCFYKEDTNKKKQKTKERLDLQKEQLNLSEEVRTIGIARCNQIIGIYENQHQLSMLAIIFTVFGFFIDAIDGVDLSWFLIPYFLVLLMALLFQSRKFYIYKENIKPIYFLKTLLEQTSPYS